ncbi:hypothetical protein M885DRAFT_569000 [Pelagophyceae sp. CCMP2097]|nr:hypothetical protein M885DRAFT_569000 [Pelagophyceae sp. CCMP2097]
MKALAQETTFDIAAALAEDCKIKVTYEKLAATHDRLQHQVRREEVTMLAQVLPTIVVPMHPDVALAPVQRPRLIKPAALPDTRVNIRWQKEYPVLVRQAVAMVKRRGVAKVRGP